MSRIREWWQKQTDTQRKTVKILAALAVVAALSALLPAFLAGDWAGLFLNLGTELAGAVVTFILINRIIGGSEERERRKADLIARMGSRVNEVAVQAVEELRLHGWLTDGSLKRANLMGANLKGADLTCADLEGAADLEEANLWKADLEGANLWKANLEWAILREADLAGADLTYANLKLASLGDAKLQGADLRGANLEWANLAGADLEGAYLQAADLWNTRFDETTILPNGSKWTPDTDMARFTDADHPDFWRPDGDWSSSHRGDSDQGDG